MHQAPQRRRSRPRIALRWAMVALALGWFAWYAYVRITTPPADSEAALAGLAARLRPPLEDDASEELAEAITALPALPAFQEPPPAGMRWVFPAAKPAAIELQSMTLGPWDPESRPYLRALIAYVNDPATTDALAKARALRDRKWNFYWQYETALLASLGAQGVPYGGMRNLSHVLTARARFRHAHLNDIEGAWDDLKTALLLSAGRERTHAMDAIIALGCESTALSELQKLLLEAEVGESLAQDMERTLNGFPDPVGAWLAGIRERADVTRCLLGTVFTDQASGGWLVLSEWTAIRRYMIPAGMGMEFMENRGRLWNLASIFFNDRDTVAAKLDRQLLRTGELARSPYREVRSECNEPDWREQSLNVLDGPQMYMLSIGNDPRHEFWRYPIILNGVASRGAARIMIALKRRRATHGRYPERLADLVPEFTAELPLDPFRDGPYAYQAGPSDGYALYSIGRDGEDDGGKVRAPGSGSKDGGFDEVYSAPRGEWVGEPILESIPDYSSNGPADSGASPP